MRALIQRINRKLRDEDEVLKIPRGRARHQLGDFFLLNWRLNIVVHDHVDPEPLARELGVLRPWEKVIEEEGATS
jgi:hypothetical protein